MARATTRALTGADMDALLPRRTRFVFGRVVDDALLLAEIEFSREKELRCSHCGRKYGPDSGVLEGQRCGCQQGNFILR